MLDVAVKHSDKLQEKMKSTWFDDDYKFWNCSLFYSSLVISEDTWTIHQFVSLDTDGEILGYIAYDIDRQANFCYSLNIINFSDNKAMFGMDVGKVLKDIFEKFNFNKLRFTVVIGNPIEKSYDKLIQIHGGRIIGIYKEETRLIDNKLYDEKIYEITRNEYLHNKNGGLNYGKRN